ncbi:hypothetical protein ACFQE8_16300 [Salinirubellus sp. GCM10025818]|jgi:hypothetical protein|uniref:hypothetical protein n=1 Tax=Salinirubellus TaxID=2162630 RepID=UPI0030CEB867
MTDCHLRVVGIGRLRSEPLHEADPHDDYRLRRGRPPRCTRTFHAMPGRSVG